MGRLPPPSSYVAVVGGCSAVVRPHPVDRPEHRRGAHPARLRNPLEARPGVLAEVTGAALPRVVGEVQPDVAEVVLGVPSVGRAGGTVRDGVERRAGGEGPRQGVLGGRAPPAPDSAFDYWDLDPSVRRAEAGAVPVEGRRQAVVYRRVVSALGRGRRRQGSRRRGGREGAPPPRPALPVGDHVFRLTLLGFYAFCVYLSLLCSSVFSRCSLRLSVRNFIASSVSSWSVLFDGGVFPFASLIREPCGLEAGPCGDVSSNVPKPRRGREEHRHRGRKRRTAQLIPLRCPRLLCPSRFNPAPSRRRSVALARRGRGAPSCDNNY